MSNTQALQKEDVRQGEKTNLVQFIAGYFVYLYKVAVRPN